MAATTLLTTHKLTVKQWKEKLFTQYQEATFFGRFKGTDENAIIQVDRDLTKDKGDAITFGLAGTLVGAGVTGDSPLAYTGTNGTGSGSEEAMTFYNQKVVIDQIRHATKLAGKMNEIRPAFNLRNQAKFQLTDWLARNEDAAIFTEINKASVIDISATHTSVTLDAVVDMKKEAMFPSGSTRKIRPISLKNGEEVFILGMNPTDAAVLKKSADFKTIQADAGSRGDSNRLFTGALGSYSGVIMHEHSGFIAGAPVLMGAQAAFLAYGDEILYGEETSDYGDKQGFMIGSVRGVALAKFNDETPQALESHGALVFDLLP